MLPLLLLWARAESAPPPDLRVARGLGPKGYGKVRISVITHGPANFSDFAFDYSAEFQYRWTKWRDPERS